MIKPILFNNGELAAQQVKELHALVDRACVVRSGMQQTLIVGSPEYERQDDTLLAIVHDIGKALGCEIILFEAETAGD